jgi:hypothetical protein
MCTSHVDVVSVPFTCAGYSERSDLAATEMFSEQGIDRTTVAEIAQRAGLTDRNPSPPQKPHTC